MLTSMKKDDIVHLAGLARIRLSDSELDEYAKELPAILEYVQDVSEVAADEVDQVPELTPRFNVFRQDEVTNEPDQFTADILAEMPHTDGRYMKVKKIIDQSS